MGNNLTVEITTRVEGQDGEQVRTYTARIGGAEFPIEVFGVEPSSDGVLVSLVVAADEVSVGRSPASAPAPAPEGKPKQSVWGDPSAPDPREAIPGWTRPVSADIAGNTIGRLA